ncbi:MAG TPA: histidinol-phosphate transaminase [Longimicrobiaceae bacterium]|nr:histidinol-phosphate transaminase [Longimicrobiaceae bacterium]
MCAAEWDLSWTGNQFLDEAYVQEIAVQEAERIDFTRKGPIDSRPLAEALAGRHGVDPDRVLVGAGSSQVLEAVLRFHSGHEIVDVVPNFHMARLVAERDGRRYRAVEVREPADLLPALAALPLRSDSLVVLSSPRNPLGYAFPEEEVRALLEMAPGPVVVDEAYVEFAPAGLAHILAEHPNLILTRTFSKAWGMANLRVGYALSARVPHRLQRDYLLPYNVGELGQRVACALLRDPGPVLRSIDSARAARDRLVARLGSEGGGLRVWPSAANYVCVEHPEADVLADALRKDGIQVAAVRELRHYPRNWPAGLRISAPPVEVEERVLAVLAGATTPPVSCHIRSARSS